MNRSSMGYAAALTIAALSILAGCQQQSQAGAEPPKSASASGGTVTGASGTQPGETTAVQAPPTSTTGGVEAPGTTPSPGTSTSPSTAPTASTNDTAPVASAEGPVSLRLAVEKGSEIKYQADSESVQKFGDSAKGKMPEPKPMKSSSQTTVKVVDVTNGKAKVEISVSGMKLSGGPDNEQAKKALAKVAADSEGVKVSVLFDSMAQPSNLQYVKGSKQQAYAAGIDTDTGFFGLSYPDKAVKPGETWSHKFDFKEAIGAMGPTKGTTWKNSDVTTVFTLKSIDPASGTATIGISAKGTPSMSMSTEGMPQPKNGSGQMPKEIVMNFQVSGLGSAVVDLKTGTPKTIDYEMNVQFDTPMGKIGQKTKAALKRIN